MDEMQQIARRREKAMARISSSDESEEGVESTQNNKKARLHSAQNQSARIQNVVSNRLFSANVYGRNNAGRPG